jgi:hypothetical protein
MPVSPGTPTFTPPAFAAPAFNTPAVALGAIVTSVVLTNPVSGARSNVPFRFAQPFKKGDLAPDSMLVGRIAGQADMALQFNVLATWPDGSVRHALISGVLPAIGAGASVSVALARSVSGTSTAAVSPSAFSPLLAKAILNFGGVAYTADATPAILALTTSKARAPGVISTEYNVTVAPTNASGTPHPDLEIKFDVVYFPAVNVFKIDVTFEHTKAFSITGDLSYSGTIQIGGATAYTLPNPVTHFPHARWMRSFWQGNAAPLVPRQNRAYFIGSKAVPNYDQTITVSETALAAAATDAANETKFGPMKNGRFNTFFPATGGNPAIGLLTGWDAATVISMDPRAIALTLASGKAGGGYRSHWRDVSSGPGVGLPLSVINWPYATEYQSAADTNPATGQKEWMNQPASSTNLTPDEAHTPNIAYLAYLLTGDLFYLEEMQFWSTWTIAMFNYAYRQKEKALVTATSQVRGQGWTLRGLFECAAFTPDSHPLKSHFKYWVDQNLANYNTMWTDNPSANGLGVNDTNAPYQMETGASGVAPWQDDHFTSSIGHGAELGFIEAARLLRWKARFQIGRLIDPQWCWTDAAAYRLAIRDAGSNKTYDTFVQVKAGSIGAGWDGGIKFTSAVASAPCGSAQRLAAMNASIPNGNFKQGEIPGYASTTESYASNLQPALALAVDSGFTDGDLAWDLFINRTVKPDYSSSPQFAIVPRGTVTSGGGGTTIPPSNPTPTNPEVKMPTANRVQETTTATTTATIPLAGKTPGRRRFVDGFTVGTTGITVVIEDNAGNFLEGRYTLTSATLLTRETILGNSLGTTAELTFPAGVKRVYHDLLAEDANDLLSKKDGLAPSQLTPVASVVRLFGLDSNGNMGPATAAAVSAFLGTATPVDNPPTLSGLSASATGATTATGTVTTNETGGTLFWLFSTSATATAAQVKAGQSKTVTGSGAQSLPGTGLTASTAYYLHVLHRDTLPQDSAVLSLAAPFTTQAAGTPTPTVTGVTVTPSSANVAGGGTQQMNAAVAGNNSPSQAVNWTITGGGSVNASGLVTAPAATSSAQTLTVRATSQQDTSKFGEATLTVAAAQVQQVDITLQPNGSTAGKPITKPANGDWVYAGGADGIENQFVAVSGLGTSALVMGWGPSATEAPTKITGQSTNTGSDVKIDAGYMGKVTANGLGYYSPPDYIWVRGTARVVNLWLWAQPVDPSTLVPTGPAKRVSSSACVFTVS